MTKENNKESENSTKCWIHHNDYEDSNVKVRHHCHITGKYRGSVHKCCNLNLKLNHKIPVVFHNLNNYNFHLIMQELGKLNLKISFIPNGLEKYLSLTINTNLIFIDSFQ